MSIKVIEGVFALHERLRGDVATVLEELGLTSSVADALWAVDPNEPPPSRRALARRLHCDPSNVTFLADRLEQHGLIERISDNDDRRVKALKLTRAGVEARAKFATALLEALGSYGFTEQDQRQLAKLLSIAVDER